MLLLQEAWPGSSLSPPEQLKRTRHVQLCCKAHLMSWPGLVLGRLQGYTIEAVEWARRLHSGPGAC